MTKKYPRVKKSDLVLKQGPTVAKINVRLDERTVISIKHISALELWKVKYPAAHVIESKEKEPKTAVL
jgi:predicted ATP-dependent Lon-type protease